MLMYVYNMASYIAYIWYGLVCTYVLWFLLQKDALLQYGEYAALLPKATEKVTITLLIVL